MLLELLSIWHSEVVHVCDSVSSKLQVPPSVVNLFLSLSLLSLSLLEGAVVRRAVRVGETVRVDVGDVVAVSLPLNPAQPSLLPLFVVGFAVASVLVYLDQDGHGLASNFVAFADVVARVVTAHWWPHSHSCRRIVQLIQTTDGVIELPPKRYAVHTVV